MFSTQQTQKWLAEYISWFEFKANMSKIGQEFLYLKFVLTNSLHENHIFSKSISARRSARCQNLPNVILCDIFIGGNVESALFHPLSLHFWKRTILEGFPCGLFRLFLAQPCICHWVSITCGKFFSVTSFCLDLLRKSVSITLSGECAIRIH